MFRRNDSDGSYDLIAGAADLEKLRRRRQSYEKTPLVRPRNAFLAFLENLFGGGDPFAVSPIASEISREADLKKDLRHLARKNFDNEGIADLHLVTKINKALDAKIDDSRARTDGVLDTLNTDLNQEEAFLDKCRPEKMRADMIGKLKSETGKLRTKLSNEAKRDAEHHVDLYEFRGRNEIHRTEAWGKRVSTGLILGLIGVVTFEFILNMFFFSGTDPTGFVGASGTAMILALATIFLGCFFGIAYQYTHPRAPGGGWTGIIMLPFLLFAMGFYVLLLTLVRLAGEAGDLEPIRAAGDMMMTNPFQGLLNLPALAYFFFTVGIISLVAWKYVSINGRFPGLRDRHLAAIDSTQDFDDSVAEHVDNGHDITSKYIDILDCLPNFIQKTVLPIKVLVMSHENMVDQYRDDVRDIEDAGELLFGFVHEELGRSGRKNARALRESNDLSNPAYHYDDRDQLFKERAETMIGRDMIKPEALESCRAAMQNDAAREIERMEAEAALLRTERRDKQRSENSDMEGRVTSSTSSAQE